AGPQRRPAGELIDHASADAGVARQLLDVGLGGEESIGPTLDHEAVFPTRPTGPTGPLRHDHSAGPPHGVEHHDRRSRPRQLPCSREPREARSRDRHRGAHSHPRPAAVSWAISATAATSSGSSLSDAVRSRCTPKRPASAWYTMSTSYSTSTCSHTNLMGTIRNASWPLPATSDIRAPASGPNHVSSPAPAHWYANCRAA